MTLKINEALAYATAHGRKINKEELAAKLFPEASKMTQYYNIQHLISGRTKRVKPETVVTICKETGVSADFLFGLEKLSIEI